MNKTVKRLAAAALAGVMMLAFTACGGETKEVPGVENGNSEANGNSETVYKIGVLQYAEHGSLDNCREGFLLGLAEGGYVEGENLEVTLTNAQDDMSICQQAAATFVNGGVDMIVPIATPAAQAAYNAAKNDGIPVVYVAVSDPESAQLVGENGVSGLTVTGVSDLIPAAKQLEMIREFLPEATKIGILYSTGEANSAAQIRLYEEAAADYGFEIVTSGVAATADIPLAAEALAAQVDCINNLTDNMVVSSLAVVLDRATKAGIPVFGSEIEQVKNGCLASEGIDYIELGKQAGRIAARVLGGEDITAIAFETMEESSTDVNAAALELLGIALPEAIAARATLHEGE